MNLWEIVNSELPKSLADAKTSPVSASYMPIEKLEKKFGVNGGRPSSLEVLGLRQEDIWNLAVQGLSSSQIAKRLSRSKGNISTRTIAKYRAEMPEGYRAQFSDFQKLPQLPELRAWLLSKFDNPEAAHACLAQIERLWLEVWKKPLESLIEQDMVNGLNYIKQKFPSGQFRWIMAIRYLIRFGVGDQAWLTRHLGTKGKKAASRMPAILTQPLFYDEIFPKIPMLIRGIEWLSDRQKDEFDLLLSLKVTTGIRTGDPVAERELWGTKLAAGKTSLTLRAGKLIDWIVFAKKKEVWHISHLPPLIASKLVAHVTKYHIGPGQSLLQELGSRDANKALGEICIKLGIEKLRLHDMRKVYLTGLCLAGIPLETAVDLNVGWKDLNTARQHYLAVKAMNADTEYEKFSQRFFK